MNGFDLHIGWVRWRIITERTTVGEIRCKPAGVCGPRVQGRYELYVLHSGSCRLTLDASKTISLTPGLVYLCQPKHHETWRFAVDRESHHSWCEIKPMAMPQIMRTMLAQAPHVLPPSPLWKQLFSSVLELRAAQNTAATLKVDLLGLALFAEYLNMMEQSRHALPFENRVSRAVEYMQAHLAESDCLRNAERAAGVSPNSLMRYFRKELDTSPARYLWKLRTEAGLEMLANSTLTCAEIAYRCGFKNPPHFSSSVKKLQGKTPGEFRRLE